MTMWNIPNLLTLLRIVLIPVFVAVFYLPLGWSNIACAMVFALAAVTDWFDGYLARKLGQSSVLGAILDPLADKVLLISSYVSLTLLGLIPVTLLFLVILRDLVIVTGALVGSSGAILSYIMCRAMNRSIINVVFGGFGSDSGGEMSAAGQAAQKGVKSASIEDAIYWMEDANKVIVVPGYGMAVAQAQHALKEFMELLEERGVEVKFAIHPVAGRMPGHMNVLLAEADVPYDKLVEMDEINPDFASTDVTLVVGANDVVNPTARTNPDSPIYGMPIINVDQARTVFVLKRSMASGFAGIENPLFFKDNTRMLFGDAKDSLEAVFKAL